MVDRVFAIFDGGGSGGGVGKNSKSLTIMIPSGRRNQQKNMPELLLQLHADNVEIFFVTYFNIVKVMLITSEMLNDSFRSKKSLINNRKEKNTSNKS